MFLIKKYSTILAKHPTGTLLGLLLSVYLSWQHLPTFGAIGIGFVAVAVVLASFQQRWQHGVVLVVAAIGCWHGLRDAHFAPDLVGVYQGTIHVQTVPEQTKTSVWRFVAKDLQTGKQYLTTLRNRSAPELGDLLRVTAEIDAGEAPRNPGAPDSRVLLKTTRLSGFMRVRQMVVVGQRGMWFSRAVSAVRGHMVMATRQAMPEDYAHLLIGLVVGDHGVSLLPLWESWYRQLGLIHILVVSGSQVSLLSGIAFLMLRPLGLSPWRQYGVITFINVVFYALTGGGASVFRAILMTQIMLYLKVVRHKGEAIDILSTTALVMLIWDPALAFNLGAQLSFLATASLVFGVPALAARMVSVPSWLREPIALSVAPFLFTMPLIWHQFQSVSLLSPLANMLVLPLIEVLVPIGFFCMVLNAMVPALMVLPMQGCLGLMQGLNAVVSGLVAIPLKPVLLPPLDTFHMAVLYVGGYGVLQQRSPKNPDVFRYGAVLILGVMVSVLIVSCWPGRYYTITYLDVGQGDATLIQAPSGKTYLIDAGNRVSDFQTGQVLWDMGERVVLPAARYYGVRRLEKVVVTHFDMDHMGGVASVVAGIPVGEIVTHHRPDMPKLGLHEAMPVTSIEAPARVSLDDHAYIVFFPFAYQWRTDKENDRSVVCLLVIGDYRFLFTGDLEAEAEAYLAETYGSDLAASWFKAGHHGSKTSSTMSLLSVVQPRITVISVGAHNTYGHPNKHVLERFKSLGIRIYRTDHDGAIEVKTDGKQLFVRTYAE